MTVATTKMSSKGQIVIPEAIRENLHLQKGASFIVVSSRGRIVLQPIQAPSLDDLDDILRETQREARKAGLKKSDIDAIIKKARSDRKSKRARGN